MRTGVQKKAAQREESTGEATAMQTTALFVFIGRQRHKLGFRLRLTEIRGLERRREGS